MINRLFCIAALLMVLPCTNTCFGQAADSARIVGSLTRCWRAFSHEYSNIYGLDDDEISRYSRQRVCFSADSINVHYGNFYTPKYSVKKVHAETYAKQNFDCGKLKLGIRKDSVYEVTISSLTRPAKDGKIHKMTDVVVFDGESIYMVVDGVIFKMLDADAKVKPSTSN